MHDVKRAQKEVPLTIDHIIAGSFTLEPSNKHTTLRSSAAAESREPTVFIFSVKSAFSQTVVHRHNALKYI